MVDQDVAYTGHQDHVLILSEPLLNRQSNRQFQSYLISTNMPYCYISSEASLRTRHTLDCTTNHNGAYRPCNSYPYALPSVNERIVSSGYAAKKGLFDACTQGDLQSGYTSVFATEQKQLTPYSIQPVYIALILFINPHT